MGTRCDPSNGKALCNTCHRWWHSYPLLAAEWCQGVMGENDYYKLLRLAKTSSMMKKFDKDFIRKEQQDAIKHMESGELVMTPWAKMFRK